MSKKPASNPSDKNSPARSARAKAKFDTFIDKVSALYLKLRGAGVMFAWQTGEWLVEIEQDGEVRANYGDRLILTISEQLTKMHGHGFSRSNLEYMRRFYADNRKSQPAGKLTWTNHVELMRISDPGLRKSLAQRAIKEGLKKYEVRRIVTRVNQGSKAKPAKDFPPLKRPADLKFLTYAVSKLSSKKFSRRVLIDCGFFANYPLEKEKLPELNITDTPSYTYVAYVDRVVDGDTLKVIIETGFITVLYDTLRLRGIDCPELGTPEGEAAKRYVQKLLPVGATVVLKSNKTRVDTHGRFVLDVFFKTGCDDPEVIIKEGVYLNQHLLDEGYAVRAAE